MRGISMAMMIYKRLAFALAPLSLLALSGCVSALTTVATAPFKVVGKAVDLATTSQDEADRNLGRDVRKQQEEEGKAIRQCRKDPQAAPCEDLRAKGLVPPLDVQPD